MVVVCFFVWKWVVGVVVSLVGVVVWFGFSLGIIAPAVQCIYTV